MSYKDWREVKLGDLCEVTSSKRIFANEYVREGVPFYRGKEIIEKHKGTPISTELYISDERYKEIRQAFGVPTKGDILLTSVGTLGVPYLLKNGDKFYFKDGNITWIKDYERGLHNCYLYYWLISPLGKEQIKQKTIGSTQQALTIQAIKSFIVHLPPFLEQKVIAATLSCLDETIELNKRTNQVLEDIAQAIFKRWFVEFEFPNEDGLPYKSSGGEMVESDLGEIPVGWQISSFLDAISILSGGTPKTSIDGYWGGDIPFFTPKDANGTYCISTEKSITELGLDKCNSILYDLNAVFISARGTVGKIALAGKQMAMNQSCYALFGKGAINQYFVYFQTKKSVTELQRSASGSVFDAIVVDTFKMIDIIVPNDSILERFKFVVEPLFASILKGYIENQKLSSLRDTLLPKLMSGEVRVPYDEEV